MEQRCGHASQTSSPRARIRKSLGEMTRKMARGNFGFQGRWGIYPCFARGRPTNLTRGIPAILRIPGTSEVFVMKFSRCGRRGPVDRGSIRRRARALERGRAVRVTSSSDAFAAAGQGRARRVGCLVRKWTMAPSVTAAGQDWLKVGLKTLSPPPRSPCRRPAARCGPVARRRSGDG